MPRSVRAGLTVTVAALSLAVMVASASANRLSVSSAHFRIIWTSLVLRNTAEAASVLCPVTLEGSFHSATITKTVNLLIGFVTRAIVRGEEPPCLGGTATILQATLPWHVQFANFNGMLPRPTGVILSLINASFQVHVNNSGLTCLARTEQRAPAQGIANLDATGRVTEFTPLRSRQIRLREGSFGCGVASGFFEETERGVVEDAGIFRSPITITLI